FEGAVSRAVEVLTPFFRKAKDTGTFVNLDMEAYHDLDLTLEVFTRLLGAPELLDYRAGIVLQAYLPDALGAMQRLQDWSADRRAHGGAPIKVRLVKGANLAMERVDAEVQGWPMVTWPSKQATDTHYKHVLAWALTPERLENVHLGVAGHNIFDLALAHLLVDARGLDRTAVEFELLAGMATGLATAMRETFGALRLYVPVVHPAEFDVAIAYLVRRLEENAAPENFMSGIFELSQPPVLARERDRFLAALAAVPPDDVPPLPAHRQDRRVPVSSAAGARAADLGRAVGGGRGGVSSAVGTDSGTGVSSGVGAFENAPNTDPSLPENREWARGIVERIPTSRLGLDRPGAASLDSAEDVDALVAGLREGAIGWAARPATDRAAVLNRVADLFEERRADLMEVAAAETGKTLDQSDPEVSEAVDFARYYAANAPGLEDLDGARFTPVGLTVVAPPWNFPLAIPAGGVLAALAAGSAAVLKPAPPSRRCGAVIAEIMWEAGVPREVFALADLEDGEVSKALVTHPGVDRVVLTGSTETAALFRSWRPDLPLLAETSGKNAIIVTPSADPDLAVRDVVASAFGHAGQKCSAASLVVLVGAVAHSRRFRDQLVDAVRSLRVGPPEDLTSEVGRVVMPADEKLIRGLTTLSEGENWVLRPSRLDPEGRYWQPGVRAGVRIDSEFHLTEYFAPVLGVMVAEDLEEALEIVNRVEFGLTSGIHSLDPEEIYYWLERVQAGNLYVNRSTTGAIVRRQPFGGWKRSAIGPGTKAGGPNYLLGFGHVAAIPGESPDAPRSPKLSATSPRVRPLLRAAKSHIDKAEWRRLRRSAASDAAMWDARYGRAVDATGLASEMNLLRYRPLPVTVRAAEGAELADVVRVMAAGLTSGSILTISHGSPLPRTIQGALRSARVTVRHEPDSEWLTSAAAWAGARPRDGRVRLVGPRHDGGASLASDLAHAVGGYPDIAVWADPVTESGHIELLPFLHEQSISVTAHRYGTPLRLLELREGAARP
nr:aldehyde dehydrogenase family protein [Actinomycetales bacterium]